MAQLDVPSTSTREPPESDAQGIDTDTEEEMMDATSTTVQVSVMMIEIKMLVFYFIYLFIIIKKIYIFFPSLCISRSKTLKLSLSC